MVEIVEIRRVDDPRDVIHRACQLLAEGNLVVFPTETNYVAAAGSLCAPGVNRLQSLQNGGVLALKSWEELHDFVAKVPDSANKLARRAWPGPLTLTFEQDATSNLFRELPEVTRQLLTEQTRSVGYRIPAHEILIEVMRLCPAPLVVNSDFRSQKPAPKTAHDAAALFGDSVSMIIDDGPCRYGEPTTAVHFQGDQWTLAHLGMISARNIERLVSEIYLFVCTGNTCRSPMAEALFRRRLAERLACQEDDLMDRGYAVLSAGLSASPGGPASHEAVAVLDSDGIDIRSHESQPVTERLLQHADHIVTMTRGHQQAILNLYPELVSRVRLLSHDRKDVSDPYGGSRREYQECKAEIERHVMKLVDDIASAN